MLEAAVKYSISNAGVATVMEDTGLIEAIKPGQAIITGKVGTPLTIHLTYLFLLRHTLCTTTS